MEPTTFKSLPRELRTKIYPLSYNLALQHNSLPPPLLLALAADPVLFAEALPIYKRINYSLSASKANSCQELIFKNKPMTELLRIRHLKLVWQSCRTGGATHAFDGDNSAYPFTMSAHKILLKNNIESLILVLERGCDSGGKMLPEYLMVASRVGVRRVVLRLGEPKKHMEFKRALDNLCGSQGVLMEDAKAGHIEEGGRRRREGIWCWEGFGGMCFERRENKSGS